MTVIDAFAKINLTLDVVGKREDGYHEVEMLMQSVSLFDRITIEKSDKGITLLCNKEGVPTDSKNTAYKAAQLFFEESGITSGAIITIAKQIPMQAGMAGGSADAAGVLHGLNHLFGNPLSLDRLLAIGLKIGADVPFCLLGGTKLARGIGEQLTDVPPLPGCFIAVAKPRENISTANAYAMVDSCERLERPDTQAAIQALKNGDLEALAGSMKNVFEQATGSANTIKIKAIMNFTGTLGAMMTGSGSAVFGIYTEEREAKLALEQLERLDCECFLTVPRPTGCKIVE